VAASLAVHAGLLAVLALHRPARPSADALPQAVRNADMARRPFTPATYARHAATAREEADRVEQIAREIEQLRERRAAAYEGRRPSVLPSPRATPAPDADSVITAAGRRALRETTAALSAQQEAVATQQEAETSLRDAAVRESGAKGAATSRTRATEAAAAQERVRRAQARAFVAQDRAQQALAAVREAAATADPRRSPQTAKAATETEKAQAEALRKQLAAEAAQKQARAAAAQQPPEAASSAQSNARELQAEAQAAQERVAELVRSLPGGDQSSQPEDASPGHDGLPPGAPPPQGGDAPDLTSAYQDARRAEARAAEAYRDLRAYERAAAERIPFEQARSATEAPPVGGAADRSGPPPLAGPAAPSGQVRETRQQIAQMAARAQRLLEQAKASQEPAAAVTIESAAALAQQDAGQRAKDLTGVTGGGGGPASKDTDRWRRGRLPGDPTRLAPQPPPALPDGAVRAIPGRRITGTGGPDAPWLFVDSWYAVGPFPNPERRNLNKPFPPETAVDLDATYAGKGGHPLRWRFHQSNGPKIVPPDFEEYAIYYFFTELWLDRPRDLWIAVGSDDQSKLWVNGRLVWVSSDQLKGWQFGEGLRRVHFAQGRNHVLVRLENGWRGAAVSLAVSTRR
jgi:hypothetical protein